MIPQTHKTTGILWHMDVTYSKDRAVIMIYDEHTQRAYIKILPKNQFVPTELENFLRTSIMVNGHPDILITDNSTYFTYKELQHLLKRNNINHSTHSIYNAKRGKFERIVSILEPLFREAKKEAVLNVDVSKGRAIIRGIKEHFHNPYREALITLHMQITEDINTVFNDGKKTMSLHKYKLRVLKMIETLSRKIDPDLFLENKEVS